MAEFNGSLFNDGLFEGNCVLGSGAARGAASIGCGGMVIKTTQCAAIASANVVMRAGRTSACTTALVGAALAVCQSARVRKSFGCANAVAVAACEGMRVRISAAHAVGVSEQTALQGRRLRTSQVQASGIAVLDGDIEKLAFPPLAQGLRVRRWSKPAGIVDLRSSGS